ncbi:MAG: hypothetical protein R3B13_33010 [Polyangiaceae bacterium]
MRWRLLCLALCGVACSSAQAPPRAPDSTEPPKSGDEAFSCEDIEGLCDETAEPEPTARKSAVCPDLNECQSACERGHAAACLEAFSLGRGVLSKAVGHQLIERACTLGNAHACLLSDDVDTRDPRTLSMPPPR